MSCHASIRDSVSRLGMSQPQQCTQCFSQHCWNGTGPGTSIRLADFDLRPRLNESLSFEQWNITMWSAGATGRQAILRIEDETAPGQAPGVMDGSLASVAGTITMASLVAAWALM